MVASEFVPRDEPTTTSTQVVAHLPESNGVEQVSGVSVTTSETNHAENLTPAGDEELRLKKWRIRRRMEKRALKLLMMRVEDRLRYTSDDSSNSSETESDEEEYKIWKAGRKKRRDAKEDQDKKDLVESTEKPDVIHRAELYDYQYRNERWIPSLFQRVENRTPIKTVEGETETTSGSVLELTTLFASPTSLRPQPDLAQNDTLVKIRAKIRTYITIRSKLLLQTLQQIVTYYPLLSNWQNSLILQEPFCVLLHYRPELTEHKEKLQKEASGEEKGGNAGEVCKQLTMLLDLLSEKFETDLAEETARHKLSQPMCTFEWIWILFKPGTKVYRWKNGSPAAYIVQWHDREVLHGEQAIITPPDYAEYKLNFSKQAKPLTVQLWCLDFDGRTIGRRTEQIVIQPFEGNQRIASLPAYPAQFWHDSTTSPDHPSVEERLIRNGNWFVKLTQRNHCHYKGETLLFPKRLLSERVMIDSTHFYHDTKEGRDEIPKLGIPDNQSYQDGDDEIEDFRYRPFGGSHSSPYRRATGCESSTSPYRSLDHINPADCNLTTEQLALCATTVWGFVLRTRKWELLNIEHITKPKFNEKLLDDLIIKQDLKNTMKALANSYTCHSGKDRWSADFVQHKGGGQILLLHGKPGVGKTTTAGTSFLYQLLRDDTKSPECVAELTKKPLLPLTCGDLGIEPLVVEENLMKWLKLGTLWEAIVLIDEAEVYLEMRNINDLQRNSLVSIFLRALEYYEGILFLTTNRVGTFDDAFISRINLIVHYPEFTEEDRKLIWQKFFEKLSRERPNIQVNYSVQDYAMTSKQVKELAWNGREIRNAFNTAVALAEDDNELDCNGKVMLHVRHLEPVVRMSAEFKNEFINIHGMNPEEVAKSYRLRSELESGLTKGKRSIDFGSGSGDYERSQGDERHLKRQRSSDHYFGR